MLEPTIFSINLFLIPAPSPWSCFSLVFDLFHLLSHCSIFSANQPQFLKFLKRPCSPVAAPLLHFDPPPQLIASFPLCLDALRNYRASVADGVSLLLVHVFTVLENFSHVTRTYCSLACFVHCLPITCKVPPPAWMVDCCCCFFFSSSWSPWRRLRAAPLTLFSFLAL